MTKESCRWFFMLFFFGISYSQAQEIAPPINPELLARPKYLAIVKIKDALQLLGAISDSVTQYGFIIDQYDPREGQLEATRSDGNEKKDHDKIVIWIERDIQEPAKYVRVYLLYGRFIEMLAEKSEVYRIVVSKMDEEKRIGKLKHSLISLSTGK